MKSRFTWLLLLPLGLAVGCDGDDFDPDTDPPAGDDDDDDIGDDDDDGVFDPARIRVLHLADALGPADVFVERIDPTDAALDLDERAADEIVVVENLAVADVTPYLTVAAGTREVELYASGADTPALEVDVPLAPETDHTLVVWGDLPDLDWLVVEDDATGVDPDTIALEILNLDDEPLTVLDATPAPVVLLAQIPPEGRPVPPASGVRVALDELVTVLGVDLDGDGEADLLIDVPEDLEPGAVNHLALRGDGEGGLEGFFVQPDGTVQHVPAREPLPDPTSLVRIANAAPLGGAAVMLERVPPAGGVHVPLVDREPEDVIVFDTMDYAEVSPYLEVVAGLRDFEIYPVGEETPSLDTAIDLAPDATHTAFVYGTTDLPEVISIADDNGGIAAGDLALQVTNVADSLGEVDLLDLTGGGATVLLDDLAVGDTARTDFAPGGVSLLGLDLGDDLVPEYTFFLLLPLPADEHAQVLLGVDPGSGIPFLFMVFSDNQTLFLSGTVVPPPPEI